MDRIVHKLVIIPLGQHPRQENIVWKEFFPQLVDNIKNEVDVTESNTDTKQRRLVKN